MLGFPIRTSPDQRLVGDSPRLNAASHVLHRLLMPRHPPCALKNLATKMLASTMQFTNNKQPTHPDLPPASKPSTGMREDRPRPEETTNPTKGSQQSGHRAGGLDAERSVPSGPNSVLEPAEPPTWTLPLPTTPRHARDDQAVLARRQPSRSE